jgi:hypothetical protein
MNFFTGTKLTHPGCKRLGGLVRLPISSPIFNEKFTLQRKGRGADTPMKLSAPAQEKAMPRGKHQGQYKREL